MREAELPVVFQPLGKTAYVLEGTRLAEAAAGVGLAFDMPCGGEGTCGKCRVIVRKGLAPAGPAESRLLSEEDLQTGVRLACQTVVRGPMTVEVPSTSLLGSHYKILSKTGRPTEIVADPAVRKQYVELPRPQRGNDEADLARVQQAIGPVQTDLALLRRLPCLLREADFRGTAVVADGELIDFEPGNTESAAYGVAVDVGTTTLVAMLLELRTAREVAVVARLNPQTGYGDDVLARILHTQQHSEGLSNLQSCIAKAIDEMVGQLAEQAGIDRRQIYEVAFSGNTTMQQLLLGLDPRHLGEVPFVPVTSDAVLAPAVSLNVHLHPRARAYVLPVIGGFVGGDTVAGVLATQLADSSGPTLLVDIGTNGEIVLAAEGKLLAASTAAGPAFEGARITHGMRAGAGAIEKVAIDGRLRINVIGGAAPVGLCGSALIDAAAELLDHGMLTPEGRLLPPGQLPENLLPDLRERVVLDGSAAKTAFVLAAAGESGTGKPVLLTQRDLRELQLASGAIRAGILVLLKRMGLAPGDLEAVYIAGGFGNYIRRENAQRIGLLPQEVDCHKIHYHGNTSLAGARLTLVSQQARRLAEELARRTEHVDLSLDPAFHEAFAESMLFPAS